MKLTVLKIQKTQSRFGKDFYYIFMKSEEGKSYKTCAYPNYGNFVRVGWDKVVKAGAGAVLEYINPIVTKGLIDADISFKLLPKVVEHEN